MVCCVVCWFVDPSMIRVYKPFTCLIVIALLCRSLCEVRDDRCQSIRRLAQVAGADKSLTQEGRVASGRPRGSTSLVTGRGHWTRARTLLLMVMRTSAARGRQAHSRRGWSARDLWAQKLIGGPSREDDGVRKRGRRYRKRNAYYPVCLRRNNGRTVRYCCLWACGRILSAM